MSDISIPCCVKNVPQLILDDFLNQDCFTLYNEKSSALFTEITRKSSHWKAGKGMAFYEG